MGVNCVVSERVAILMFWKCLYDTESASLVGVAWPLITSMRFGFARLLNRGHA